jgi:hypothetical protein
MKDWLPFLGVIIAQFIVLLIAYMKIRADDKRRWYEERRRTYVRFLERVWRLQAAVSASRTGDILPGSMSTDEVLLELQGCQGDAMEMDLLSSLAVSDSATGVWAWLTVLWASTDEDDTEHLELEKKTQENVNDALKEFIASVRNELGLKAHKERRLTPEELQHLVELDADD